MENQKKHYHFIGIGGIGMGALASLLASKGHTVTGSDIKESLMTENLRKLGVSINIGHDSQNLKGADYVVYSSAIDANNPEIITAKKQNTTLLQRAQVLASIVNSQIPITVAGAHGKTTTTSMISNLLVYADLKPTVAVGGIVNGRYSHAQWGDGRYFVAEVDESDGSFLYFLPKYSVITNIDFEHVDYYHNWDNILRAYQEFILCTQKDGCLIVCGDDKRLLNLVKESGRSFISYGISQDNMIRAESIILNGLNASFDCVVKGENKGKVSLCVPGEHNVLNALATIGLGLVLNIDFEVIVKSLKEFRSVQRRFQIKNPIEGVSVVDDYGHHPTEILATLKAAKTFKPKRLIVIFQPHRYSRTKYLMEQFADSLLISDHLILTDIYAASENPIEGVSSEKLFELVRKKTTNPVQYLKKQEIIGALLEIVQSGDMVVFLGAGDINQIAEEFSQVLSYKEHKNEDDFNSDNVGDLKPEALGQIVVLMGGCSCEREISLKSGNAIYNALKDCGFNVMALDIRVDNEKDIFELLKKKNIDIAFIALHGKLGEDGTIQSILEQADIIYTGSGIQASRLAINKVLTQKFLEEHNLPVPKNFVVSKGENIQYIQVVDKIGGAPFVVKPSSEGSSFGITFVDEEKKFEEALQRAFSHSDQALIEKYIQGRELTVGILGDKPLSVIEILHKGKIFDFESKYLTANTEYIIPAQISSDVALKVQALALNAYKLLGCRDMARVDMMLDNEMSPFILEINTIPGFTSTSLLPKAAKEAGLNFQQLCLKLIELAYQRKKEKASIVNSSK